MIVESSGKYPTLNYEVYKTAFKNGTLAGKIAEAYHESLDRVNQLSADPDHGGHQTLSSLLETMVAFELEQHGILGCQMIRGPAHADLEDKWGRRWDVKTPPYLDTIGFNVQSVINSIMRKLAEFPEGDVGILLDVSFLNYDSYLALQEGLKTKLTPQQKFLIRQVAVRGVL